MSDKIKRIKAEFGMVTVQAYPKEETWRPLCPSCGEMLKVRLYFDREACEFQIEISHEEG